MIPRRYLPSIPSLLALEALDRLGTASAAAAELALTQGAVSKQLQVLEGQLGRAAGAARKPAAELTPAGRDFVAEVRKALKIITDASLTLRANPERRRAEPGDPAGLRDALAGAAAGRLCPRHPEVTVNLSTRLRPFDFALTAFDAAIHYGRLDWPGASF
jgi:LysR family glycine cleavage system transcriptional activator